MIKKKSFLMSLTLICFLAVSIIFFAACGKKDESQRASEVQVIKIGAVLPLTGPIAMIGEWHKNGIDFWQQKSQDLQINYVDSEGNPRKAISGLKLIENEVDGVVGTLSSVMISVIKSVETQKPIFLVNVSSPNVTMLAENVYRYNIDVEDEFIILSEEMKKNNVEQIGILYINDEYGLSAINSFKKKLSENNIEVKLSESYEPIQMDFKDITSKIANYDFPLVVFGYGRSYISLIKSIAEIKYQKPIYTDYSMFVKEFKKPLTGCGLEVFYIAPFINNESFNKWIEEYAKQYQSEPNYAVCISFDVIKIMNQVLKEEKPLTKMKLKNHLEKNKVYSVYGYRITSDEHGEIKVPLQVIHETL